ncbi:MAG TPA: c-type cytochrome [Thermoanaerobaculia bacterium]|nr:c-type cytochrome [Thermoanaerobaculia bacterium]
MKPQEPIPHNYSMRKLNAIFALSALGLLAVTGAMVMYDYVRGWKWFQMEFNRIQSERIQRELEAANNEEARRQLAEIDQQMKDAQAEIAKDRDALVTAQKELESWEGRHYAADQDYRFAKAILDAKRYELEASIVQGRHTEERQREFDALVGQVDDLQIRLQAVTRDRDAARARVDSWLGRIKEVETRRKELTASVDLLNKQLKTVSADRDFFILNAPMLDFVNPTMKIEQVVLGDLFIDMNYMSVPRVDRCMTCHRAIDRPGFESKVEAERLAGELRLRLDKNLIPADRRAETEERVEQLDRIQNERLIMNPFRTHPRLETFVGSASPHPLLEYGCTACHRGQDRATEFGRAGHTPMSKRMELRWKKASMFFFPTPRDFEKRNWGYAVNPFLDTPMYPRQHYEAGCLKCHAGQITVEKAQHITTGTHMVELYGCHSCHKISNWRFENLQKPGPTLEGIAEKTTPEWAFRWIAAPNEFRSTTRMPSFFFQRNMVGPAVPLHEREQNIRYQNAEIHAIVEYLFANSTRRTWQGPAGGDAARGREIVSSVGCLGCHIDTDTVTDAEGKTRLAHRDDFPLERHFGFNFTGTGTKTHPGWVFNWVKNPRVYDAATQMPDLRLSDQEAADVTAYLMTMQKPEFMQKGAPAPDPQAVRELAKGYLINTLTDRDANTRLQSMPLREQLIYLGQRSIEKYGCYSCHDIKGFDGLKPIGTELTTEGSKNLHLFDFGYVHDYEHEDGRKEHILHTVPSWIYHKIRSPRVYDDERTKPYNDKLKMPNFNLTENEARTISSVILGLTKERVSENRMAARDAHVRAAEEGRKIVSQRNCRGCHIVDGYGRAIGPLIADENFRPPDLSPQGARAQSAWMFNFLKDPTTMKIRPWMSVRMPTFHFTDEEANTLVTGFAAQGRVPAFDTQLHRDPSPQNVAIGREVFNMLRCAQCHVLTPVNHANPPVPDIADTTALAPNLTLSRVRLRHEWIEDWIRRPDDMIPGTRMPTNFPRSAETGGFTSPLGAAIDTPQFAASKARLLPYFRGEDELRETMADAVALTGYMRDYIWSIGGTEMITARPDSALPAPQEMPRTPPATPVQTGVLETRGPAVAGNR